LPLLFLVAAAAVASPSSKPLPLRLLGLRLLLVRLSIWLLVEAGQAALEAVEEVAGF
jgi:hypothetical protein